MNEDDLITAILSQYATREKCTNTKYNLHPNYNCECSICSAQKMTDNQIKQDLQLDPFYETSVIEEDMGGEVPQESFVQHFRVINTMLENKRKQTTTEIERPITVTDPVDFLSLTLKLMQPNKNGRMINIRVMDTLFFYQREPCMLVYNDKDRGLKIIKEKGLLSNMLELRNFFISRRFQYDTDVRTAAEKRINPSFNSMEFDQKSAEIVQRIKKETQRIPINTKDFAIVRFRNGGQQIMTQLEVMQLFDKRRIDAIWDQIILIQAFPYDFKGILNLQPGKDTDKRFHKVHYDKSKIKYQKLFDKALEQVCHLNNPNYWSGSNIREMDKYMKQLKEDVDQYLNYMVYQVVHFFEAYHKRKLTKIRVDFAEDDFQNYYVVDAYQIRVVDLDKIKWNEIILKEIQQINPEYQEEIKQSIHNSLHMRQESMRLNDKQPHNTQRLKCLNEAMGEINQYLRDEYVKKIEEAEIELRNDGDIEKTNQIFQALNPKISLKFSYMTNIHKEDEQINRKNLLGNFPIDKKRFLNQQRFDRQSKAMQYSKATYHKQLKVNTSSPFLDFHKPYCFTTKGRQYLIKTTQLRRSSTKSKMEPNYDRYVNNYSGQQVGQSGIVINEYKY